MLVTSANGATKSNGTQKRAGPELVAGFALAKGSADSASHELLELKPVLVKVLEQLHSFLWRYYKGQQEFCSLAYFSLQIIKD